MTTEKKKGPDLGKRLYGETGHNELGTKYAERIDRFAKRLVRDAMRESVDTRDLTLLAFNSIQFPLTMARCQMECERRERKGKRR